MRVLVVEDQVLFRKGLKGILEADEAILEVAEASTAEQALERLSQRHYDLVITDLALPDHDGLWLLARFRQLFPHLPTLVLTMHQNPRMVGRALETGATGYLLKTALPQQLLEAVATTAAGRAYVQPDLAFAQAGTSTLSLTDLELLHLVRRGYSEAAIQVRLCLSKPSLRSKLRRICKKLDSPDLESAVARALQESILVPDCHRTRADST